MKKLKTEKNKNKSRLLIGSLLFFIGISILSFEFISKYNDDNKEKNAIEEYYIQQETKDGDENALKTIENDEQTKYDYIGVIKIPKINLIKGLVSPSSKYNNINYNIQIIEGSDMPDVTNGCFILAAHSGNARISYFKHLDQLSIDDDISLDYDNKTYKYKVVNIYEVEKTGSVTVKRDYDKSTLALITCKHNTDKQIVVVANLMEVS